MLRGVWVGACAGLAGLHHGAFSSREPTGSVLHARMEFGMNLLIGTGSGMRSYAAAAAVASSAMLASAGCFHYAPC